MTENEGTRITQVLFLLFLPQHLCQKLMARVCLYVYSSVSIFACSLSNKESSAARGEGSSPLAHCPRPGRCYEATKGNLRAIETI